MSSPPVRELEKAMRVPSGGQTGSPSMALLTVRRVGEVRAELQLRRAIHLDPNYPEAHRYLGHLLSQTGRHDEARSAMRRARALDPLHAMNHAISSQVAFQARDYRAAVEHARQSIVLDPEFWIG